MPHDRFFIDTQFQNHQSVVLEGNEAHHLTHVMRGRIGDQVDLVNGKGQLAQATITTVGKREVTLQVDVLSSETKPAFEMILAQAMPKLNRLENILEKGTELGMTQIWLFPGERSEKKDLSEAQLQRASAIMVAAMKQCGSLHLPTLHLLPPLNKWSAPSFPFFFGDLSPKAPLFGRAWKKDGAGIVFAVGPEAGFSPKEISRLQELGGTGVKLHPNILRTDTAPLVALSLIQYRLLESKEKEA